MFADVSYLGLLSCYPTCGTFSHTFTSQCFSTPRQVRVFEKPTATQNLHFYPFLFVSLPKFLQTSFKALASLEAAVGVPAVLSRQMVALRATSDFLLCEAYLGAGGRGENKKGCRQADGRRKRGGREEARAEEERVLVGGAKCTFTAAV